MNINIKPGIQDYLSCLLIQRYCCDCTIQNEKFYDQTYTLTVRDEFGHGAVKLRYHVPESIIADITLTPEEKALKIYSEIKGFLNG